MLTMWSACLRILQVAMVYVNTLMLPDVLADPEWEDVLTSEDRRGLTLAVLVTRAPARRGQAQHEQQAHPRRKLTPCGSGAVDSF